ncbi:MAG TPA: Asp-tRNA(Asn)/Glu-tRNA(Gln) amidotransferase subunit GatB [Gemmatirosa sp.]|nr:Asp-tRNA(Asn)/Glu-tRNA(Gln) amidotransferase subunit GatB [Gemmatirosa sp.]
MSGGAPDPVSDRYEMVVGLEVHVQLATATKAFCNCAATFGDAPNANTCPVCLGLPGTLPVLNARAVELAVRTALALGCDVQPISVFARKHYFYPDLPRGYQITQFDRPLATGGHVRIGETPEGAPIDVAVTRLHLEEDAGRSLHDRFPAETALDLNRAGVPLVEIVSAPELRSTAEVRAYLAMLRLLVRYVGASEASMEEGSLRVDANVSVRRRGDAALGTRTEIKNLNSFAAVERALQVEFARHAALLERGERVVQQTMLWDEPSSALRPARAKEESDDYRYFPEPDLAPLVLTSEWIAARRESLPELPRARRARLKEAFGLEDRDADVLTNDPALADYYESVARLHGDGRTAAHWVLREVLAALGEHGLDVAAFAVRVRPADLAALLDMVRDARVSRSAGARVFATMARTGEPPARIAQRDGLLQVSDDGQLEAWIDEVLAEHPDEARRYAAGESRLQGVLVGLVMKRSGGSADPKRVNALLAGRAAGHR